MSMPESEWEEMPEPEREEMREKTCTSNGLGFAAAAAAAAIGVVAIGVVGVGAALYYFLKRPEEEQPQTYYEQRSWSLEECSICMDKMLKGEKLLCLPCAHRFHVGCINPWLKAKHTCPICRSTAM